MQRAGSLEKTLMLGKIGGRKRKGQKRIKMVGWHCWLNEHEFKQTPGDSEGQGSLVCYSPWGCSVDWATEQVQNSLQVSGEPLSLSPWFSSLPSTPTEVPISVTKQHNGKPNLKQLIGIGLQAFSVTGMAMFSSEPDGLSRSLINCLCLHISTRHWNHNYFLGLLLFL